MVIDYLADHERFVSTLVQWHHQEWGYLCPGDSIEARTQRLRAVCGRCQIPTVFVAFSGAEVLGSAMLLEHDMHTRRELSPWLSSLFVAPNQRRRGIGGALVRRVTEEARVLGVRRIYLYTSHSEQLYAGLGWAPFHRTQHFGSDVVVMTKDIVPNKAPEPTTMAVTPRAT